MSTPLAVWWQEDRMHDALHRWRFPSLGWMTRPRAFTYWRHAMALRWTRHA